MSGRMEAERAYYMPPGDTGLAREWERKSRSQQIYLNQCVEGHRLIANHIIEARQAGKRPDIKSLYRIAARVRRAMAALNQKEDVHSTQNRYGQPRVNQWEGNLTDYIYTDPESRYAKFFDQAQQHFEDVWEAIKEEPKNVQLGEAYRVETEEQKRERTIRIYHKQASHPIACLSRIHGGDGPVIRLGHAAVKDVDVLFKLADKHLQQILQTPDMPYSEFMHNLGEISLHLFHAVPLSLGSQTSTLMVLAGIMKAQGYEVQPRKLQMDHFIEAELFPYEKYTSSYGESFIKEPARLSPPLEQAIPVDIRFIEQAELMRREMLSHSPSASSRLTAIAKNGWFFPHQIEEITRVNYVEGKLSAFIKPRTLQEQLNYAIEFTGHQELAYIIGLTERQKAPLDFTLHRSRSGKGMQI